MDFSHAGYGGGGVAIPTIQAVRTLRAIGGDNTAQIQSALDAVAAMPLQDGFRGAVQLGPGAYDIAGTLNISSDGVVLRGSGSGDKGTILRLTGAPHRLLELRGSGTWKDDGEPVKLMSEYVPSGADSFTVTRAAAFHPGDRVLMRRRVTEAWVHFMGMDTLVRNGKPQTWIRPGTLIRSDRTIQAIAGDRITLEVPLSDAIDPQFFPQGEAATLTRYTFAGRIQHNGIEALRVTTPAADVPITGPQFTFLRIDAVRDAWVRDVAIEETQNGIVIGSAAQRVTFEAVRIAHSIHHSGAAAPADFSISGTQILLDRCSVTGEGTWPVVTQATVTGPNVVLNFHADSAGVSPHQRWATGLLVDGGEFRNNTAKRPGIAFSNRKTAGSGHGWDIGWAVAWNVKSNFFLVQQPPGAVNWCIGCVGEPSEPESKLDSPGKFVTPASLYLQQLEERLGKAAVAAIGY